ncbi:lantibiotic dehydratase C-terminal domain-containing protein [Actinomyces ruminicola]|uniref:lantibiotic dehydratase C-terminal domain-containing protein n=1 Tax=Actinomyces ruminicola TaxID=332524 RepID=UPI0011CBCC73|nr:lantibiotic dehydratase C-terminal domain-containing protein [Actinomyces ruminicola]
MDSQGKRDGYAWLSVHMRCDSDTDVFLREGVFPILDALSHEFEIRRYFFLRYWMSGAHIRLRIRTRSEAMTELANALVGATGNWLKEQTVVNPFAEEWYRQIAPELASREHETGALPRWLPHGTVWVEPYVAETNKYGVGSSLDAFERQFCSSSMQARTVLSGRPTLPRLVSLVTMLMYRTWCDPTLRMGPEWVSRSKLVDRWRPASDNVNSNGLRLRMTPEQLASGAYLQASHGVPQWQSDWVDSLVVLSRRLMTIELGDGKYRDDILESRDHCVHLMCNRLGVTIGQEHAARAFAYEAVRRRVDKGAGSGDDVVHR